MSVLALGLLFGAVTLIVMFSGMPIAFSLGFVAMSFMAAFMPASSLDTVTQNVYEEMASITLLSIPLFILKGAAIGRSDAGRDLYLSMHAWMQRVPGGLGIANVFTCALFAAMAGSSPATCSAIGSAGIPEMRKRGYSPGFAAGIIAAGGTLGILLPPSITMILYAVAAEVSLGRLFLGATLKESTMLMFIIGMSLFFSYVMSYLHISQSAAQGIVDLQLSKWFLLAAILFMVIVLGFFLPPVSIILMTAPIVLPPLKTAGFDLIWFGVLMTIVMEMGLIHPPVGLNIFVIKNIAPDIPLRDVVWGVMPFVALMFVAIFLICFFPGIATGFPNWVMGSR